MYSLGCILYCLLFKEYPTPDFTLPEQKIELYKSGKFILDETEEIENEYFKELINYCLFLLGYGNEEVTWDSFSCHPMTQECIESVSLVRKIIKNDTSVEIEMM